MKNIIQPSAPWLDTNAMRIEAHGGTMYYENGTYYWIGEDKSHTAKKGKIWTWGVKCYSSRDLCSWKDEGHIVFPEPDDSKSLFHPNRRLDRPHLIFNPATRKYVLWLKYCDKSHFSVLTADHILGPYTLVEPFLQPGGFRCGDFDLAADETTGEAYLYFESNHDSLHVVRLNSTYTGTEGAFTPIFTNQKPPYTREGVAHFRRNGKHYLITSGMTGYVPNPSEIAVSDSWTGPFKILGDPCVNDASSATFNSQSSCVFQIHGTDTFVMMADRWVPYYEVTAEKYAAIARAISAHSDKSVKASLRDMITMLKSPMMGSADTSQANYVWLPFIWEDDFPKLCWKEQWTPNLDG